MKSLTKLALILTTVFSIATAKATSEDYPYFGSTYTFYIGITKKEFEVSWVNWTSVPFDVSVHYLDENWHTYNHVYTQYIHYTPVTVYDEDGNPIDTYYDEEQRYTSQGTGSDSRVGAYSSILYEHPDHAPINFTFIPKALSYPAITNSTSYNINGHDADYFGGNLNSNGTVTETYSSGSVIMLLNTSNTGGPVAVTIFGVTGTFFGLYDYTTGVFTVPGATITP